MVKLAFSTVTKKILIAPRPVNNDTFSSSYGQKHNPLTWVIKVKPPKIPLQESESGHLPLLIKITCQETQAQPHICWKLDTPQCPYYFIFFKRKSQPKKALGPDMEFLLSLPSFFNRITMMDWATGDVLCLNLLIPYFSPGTAYSHTVLCLSSTIPIFLLNSVHLCFWCSKYNSFTCCRRGEGVVKRYIRTPQHLSMTVLARETITAR